MKIIINLCKFGTLYLWILLLKVLQVSGRYRPDTAAAAVTLIMKPYPYQIFDDYTDELLNERKVAPTTLWQTKDKHLYYKHLPLTKAKTAEDIGHSMASNEIAFANLNDFDSYKIKTAIWPRDDQQQHLPTMVYDKFKQQRHSLQHVDVFDNLTPVSNIRYKNGILPIIMAKRLTKPIPTTKTKIFTHDVNIDDVAGVRNDDGEDDDDDDVVKDNIFPLKDDDALNVDVVEDENENEFASSNGNGNESLNYSDNNEVTTNYMASHNIDVNDNGIEKNHLNFKYTTKNDKRAKPSYGHTPFLPSISGGAMTNLGKFFRDLSKNVHMSEHYQWGSEHQKLLEGDPNFANIHHQLTKPKSTSDPQTSEWIKAIRFYRPSQKIRSLVAMNPHGQWEHSSQFIDPNYMWVGLGK